MYEAFYGLTLKPFTLAPNPEFLYRGATHRLALSTLEYGILNRAGFVVLTGEPGMGKTTLIQQLLAEHRDHFSIGLITNTHGGMDSLLPWILLAFGLSDKEQGTLESFSSFSQFVAGEGKAGRRVLLIVDEAQNLGVQLLEELRLLSNMNTEKEQTLQIILSGQPDLRTLLQRKDLTQFAQRVTVDYALEPFKEEDTLTYISHRLRVAGRIEPLFTHQAGLMIHRLTGGIPRLINQLCDTSLTYGFAEQTHPISTALVTQAATDRSKGGILPLAISDSALAMTPEQQDTEQKQMAAFAAYLPQTSPHAHTPVTRSVASPQEIQPKQNEAESYERGLALKKVGLFKEALHQFSLAAQDPSLTFKAIVQVGICLNSASRPEEAVTAFRKALQAKRVTSRDTIQVRYLLARALESLGRVDEALEHYRWIRREDPSFKDVGNRIEQLSHRRVTSAKNGNSLREGFSWLKHLHRIFGISK